MVTLRVHLILIVAAAMYDAVAAKVLGHGDLAVSTRAKVTNKACRDLLLYIASTKCHFYHFLTLQQPTGMG